jgi:hypothetical protein
MPNLEKILKESADTLRQRLCDKMVASAGLTRYKRVMRWKQDPCNHTVEDIQP